jgi:hypothetical protein
MKLFIRKPNIELLAGVRITKDTHLEFSNENTEQIIDNLVLRSTTNVKGVGYESKCETTIYLQDGDVLIFEEEGRGYIKPVEGFVTIKEAIDDLINIQDLGEQDVCY